MNAPLSDTLARGTRPRLVDQHVLAVRVERVDYRTPLLVLVVAVTPLIDVTVGVFLHAEGLSLLVGGSPLAVVRVVRHRQSLASLCLGAHSPPG